MKTEKKVAMVVNGINSVVITGETRRIIDISEVYRLAGLDVTLIIFFKDWIQYVFGARRNLLEELEKRSIKCIPLPYIPISVSPTLYKIREIYSSLAIKIIFKVFNFQICHFEIGGIGISLSFFNGLRVASFHGDSVAESTLRYGETKKWLTDRLRNEQRDLAYCSHLIIVASQNLRKLLREIYDCTEQQHVIFPCIPAEVKNLKSTSEILFNRKINDSKQQLRLGYIGGDQIWQNVDTAIFIASQVADRLGEYLTFHLYGHFDYARIDALNKMYPRIDIVSKSVGGMEKSHLLTCLDAGFVIRAQHPVNLVSSPTKTREYLIHGVPVICTKYAGDWADVVTHEKNGFVLESLSPSNAEIEQLVKFLLYVMENRSEVFRASQHAIDQYLPQKIQSEFADKLRLIDIVGEQRESDAPR